MNRLLAWAGANTVPPNITSVSAISGSNLLHQYGGPDPSYRVVWVVLADGRFVNLLGYQTTYGTSGYFTFDDQGDLIGMGSHS